MARVTLNNVYKRYTNNMTAVHDFNLDINDREFLVLVGPSGCGKSTTLRMIAGLEEISDGDLLIGDRRVNDVAPKDRDIAMVFQSYALYPHMNVYENMAFGLKLRKFSKAEIDKRIQEAARILDISHLLDRKPKALSGGQRQRVALGRAIVREPQVFLMDEPLSNLDAKLRVQMRTEISKLHQRLETTIIYVTHDQTEAMTMGDRIVVMKDGHIQQVGTPTEIYNLPANKFVAGFIGSPSMNFLEGKLKEEGGSVFFATTGLQLQLPEDKAKTLRGLGYIGKDVVFGIRPEDLYSDNQFIEANPFKSKFEAEVDVVENLGSELYVYFTNIGGVQMTARVDAREGLKPKMKVSLAMDLAKCHVFDKETEKSLF
ncbi:sn-glycerol-3-phosphate ABC transporter ATP-binding protein UgpC [Brevibacillus fluminis]|uniref:sn-glycerol-3-phosphate ABC transporter ATP-binding protein UgpC n=1 Tax=Brevibacillus fluminis TaxID=511487 RepID=A0A3M8DBL4_9BACL|nr:sn-glycerol-3-phosphate ABC transporter ATP-binding protein UgpC [Brevibacillus fluminis]RNB85021.1 sn-glycerol-3-phosphate ABC transporter ATP-binding protein UgpC [Brevibacillus fluminis]